jgi:hypothetical protein
MSPSAFRSLIGLSIVTGALAGAVDLVFPSLVPQGAVLAIAEEEAKVPMSLVAACVVLGLAVLLSLIAATVGMLLLQRWGRSLATATTLASLPFWPLLGVTVQSGWASALLQVSAMAWGATLACAYWTPLASQFSGQGSNNSSKPTPLRGAA